MPRKLEKRTHWKLEHRPWRDSTGNRTLAIFFDADDPDRRAEVSIDTRTLGQIGDLPGRLPARKLYAAEVLLAMLEESTNAVKPGQLIQIDEAKANMLAVKNRLTHRKKM